MATDYIRDCESYEWSDEGVIRKKESSTNPGPLNGKSTESDKDRSREEGMEAMKFSISDAMEVSSHLNATATSEPEAITVLDVLQAYMVEHPLSDLEEGDVSWKAEHFHFYLRAAEEKLGIEQDEGWGSDWSWENYFKLLEKDKWNREREALLERNPAGMGTFYSRRLGRGSLLPGPQLDGGIQLRNRLGFNRSGLCESS